MFNIYRLLENRQKIVSITLVVFVFIATLFCMVTAQAASTDEYGRLLSELKLQAEKGDAESSYQVAQKIIRCRNLPTSEQERNDLIESIKVTGGEESAKQFEAVLAECSAVTPEDINEIEFWLRQTASQDHADAQLNYYVYARPQIYGADIDFSYEDQQKISNYEKNAISFLEAAAAEGIHEALFRLGSAYGQGIGVDKNPVLSAAYFTAYSHCTGESVNEQINAIENQFSISKSSQRSIKETAASLISSYCAE